MPGGRGRFRRKITLDRAPANSRRRLVTCSALLLTVALPAFAQEGLVDAGRIEKIEVTGSNIKRTDIETALPVQIIARDDIDRSGAVNAAALLSQVSANLVGRTDSIFIAISQSGLSSANLRGLGEGSTLVLLNGRRAANYAANGATVNLNFIPVSAIERVEILKDGASAIYGADAMAGVINFILRRDFRGTELSAYGAVTEHSGGNQQQATLTAGYGDLGIDRFNVFVTANYQNSDALRARDRSFSSTAYRPDEYINGGPQFTATFPANIRTGPSTWLNPSFASGCMPLVTVPLPGTQMCGYDQLAVVNLLPSFERTSVLGGATLQVNADHRLFAQYLYSYDHYTLIRNVVPASEAFNPDRQPILYPADGPFFPTEFAAAHGIVGDLNLYYRAVPLGPITDKLQTRTQHLVAGAEGITAGWNYDVAWIYSENRQQSFLVSGALSEQRLIDAMATGLVNPFGPSGPEGDALLARASVSGETFSNKAVTDSFEAKASREIYDLPAGAVAFALGVEARREQLDILWSPELSSADTLGSVQARSTSGSRSVDAIFAELDVPIAQGVEAQLAVRYDRYSDFGGTTNPKVAVRWQSDKAWLVRTSYGTGFRAPTLPDLFTPDSQRVSRPQNDRRRCPLTHLPSDCNASFRVVYGGDPDLQPEKSKQWNLGVVWAPVSGFSVGVDYWSIRKTDTIGALTDDQIFTNFDLYEQTHIVRGAPDPAFPVLPGPIDYVIERSENLGELRTSGIDVDLACRGPVTSIGRFGASLNGTYVAEWQQQLDGVHYIAAVGRNVVGAVPRWRHYATLNWSYGLWGATLAQVFSAGYTEVNSAQPFNERKVGAYDVWNLQGTYGGFRNTMVTLGIKNLFDRAPPFSNQTALGLVMFDPRYADPRGRMFYAQLAFAFK
jgi:iron complex outermembrane recepter protein